MNDHLGKQAYMVGDNYSVILNTTLPSSAIKKKHLACNYHRIREAIAGKIINFGHIVSGENLADICTKPLAGPQFSHLLKDYLFRTVPGEQVEDVTEGE